MRSPSQLWHESEGKAQGPYNVSAPGASCPEWHCRYFSASIGTSLFFEKSMSFCPSTAHLFECTYVCSSIVISGSSSNEYTFVWQLVNETGRACWEIQVWVQLQTWCPPHDAANPWHLAAIFDAGIALYFFWTINARWLWMAHACFTCNPCGPPANTVFGDFSNSHSLQGPFPAWPGVQRHLSCIAHKMKLPVNGAWVEVQLVTIALLTLSTVWWDHIHADHDWHLPWNQHHDH